MVGVVDMVGMVDMVSMVGVVSVGARLARLTGLLLLKPVVFVM